MNENPNPDVASVRSTGGGLCAMASLCIVALATVGVLVAVAAIGLMSRR